MDALSRRLIGQKVKDFHMWGDMTCEGWGMVEKFGSLIVCSLRIRFPCEDGLWECLELLTWIWKGGRVTISEGSGHAHNIGKFSCTQDVVCACASCRNPRCS